MFNFLNSTILFAATAALIPLIIHLFSRRRVRIVEFSSLKHLKAMQKRQVRRLRIRQLLLLLLRMLIILTMVLAFARPTTKGGNIGSHAAVSAVILFDNSASMDRYVIDGNLFEIARKRTSELLDAFGEVDQVVLTTLDRTAGGDDASRFASSAVAAEQIQRLSVGSSKADLESTLDNAVDLLESTTSLNKEIYIVTDRQRCSLPDRAVLSQSDGHVYIVDIPIENDDNCGIASLDFGGQLLIPGHDFDITATVRNYGASDRSDLIASLFLDGNRVSQTNVEVAAGQEAAVRFSRSVSRTGFHSGYVELSDDKFIRDNRYYFSFHIPDRFNLLVIRGDDAARFISLALVPEPSLDQYWSVKEADPDNLSGVNFLDYDVIVLAGAPDLLNTYVQRLKSFVKRGKSMFVAYGGQTDINHFNSRWSELTGVIFDEPVKREFTRAGYYTVSSIDINHPIFSVYGLENSPLPEIKFFTLPKLHLNPGARALMHFSGDRPALVEATYGRGKVLTFTGPMSPRYGDLTSHAFFVPFVSRVAEYLASDLSSFDLRLVVGDNITRSVSLRGSISMPLQLETPDGRVFSIPPEEIKGALLFRPQPIDQPGIYRASYLGREIDRFAVNLDPTEGDLAAADFDQLATALGAGEHHILARGSDLATAVSELRLGKELWQLFLWLAVILVFAEMLLSRSTPPEES